MWNLGPGTVATTQYGRSVAAIGIFMKSLPTGTGFLEATEVETRGLGGRRCESGEAVWL